MELIIEPGQTIKFAVESTGRVEFDPVAFGQHCFVADTCEEITNQYVADQPVTVHAFNASYETMTVRLKI